MKVRQIAGRGAAIVGVGALCLAAGGIGIAAATNGGSFILGGSNTATHTTTLKDTTGTPLSLLAKKGAAPLAVNSNKLVKHLNAFEVGGLTANQLKTSGSGAQLTTDLSSGTPSVVSLPKLTTSGPPFVLMPVVIVSTAKLAAGSYLVTGAATGSEAACWVGTTASPGSAHQYALAQDGSAVVTQLVKAKQGQKINEYCSDISTTDPGTLLSAGITALHVASASVGTAGTRSTDRYRPAVPNAACSAFGTAADGRQAKNGCVGLTNDAAVIPLALGAAGSFAVANVAQMRAARRVEGPTNLHPNLLLRLVRDPLWIGGLVASVAGFMLQAIALYLAPVVLVQPLIVTELLFALPLAASLAGVRLHGREWLGALLVAAGISCFVFVGQPSGQGTYAAGSTWLLTTLCVGAGVVLLGIFAESRRGRPALRASALAVAASVCFGFLAVLTKVVGHEFSDEHLGALTHPQPWLMAVTAIGGLLLAQTAFRIAPLSVSLPLIDVGEPLIGSVLAVLILGERLDVTSGTVAGVVVSAMAIAGGVAVLDTSPRVHSAQQDIDKRWDQPPPHSVASATH